MTLDDLRVFLAVCRTGNLSSVARDLSRTQSAVSQHVKRLEKETGLALVERRPRGVVPTPAGRMLYQTALDSLTTLETGMYRLAELREGNAGTMKITTGGVTVRHFMAGALSAFRGRHPDASLEFRSSLSTRRCIELLRGGEVDLAWITLTSATPGIEQRLVLRLPWVLVTSSADPIASRESIQPDDLTGINYIAHPPNSASGRLLEREFTRLECAPRQSVGMADWDTAILLAELGIGHAVLPMLPRLVIPENSPVKAIPIPDLTPSSVGWAARQWNALSPLATEFADLVASDLACQPTNSPYS